MHLNDEIFRVRQHTRLNDVTIEQALLLKTNDELKAICRQYGIKGFSNKNKQNLVKLIMTAFSIIIISLNKCFLMLPYLSLVFLLAYSKVMITID